MSSVAFDVEGARKAGYSNGEIATFLASKKGFDIDGARSAGYGDEEIIFIPSGVRTDSGWNWTPSAGRSRCRTDITTSSSLADPERVP